MFIHNQNDQRTHFNGNRLHSHIRRHININTVNPGVYFSYNNKREKASGKNGDITVLIRSLFQLQFFSFFKIHGAVHVIPYLKKKTEEKFRARVKLNSPIHSFLFFCYVFIWFEIVLISSFQTTVLCKRAFFALSFYWFYIQLYANLFTTLTQERALQIHTHINENNNSENSRIVLHKFQSKLSLLREKTQ